MQSDLQLRQQDMISEKKQCRVSVYTHEQPLPLSPSHQETKSFIGRGGQLVSATPDSTQARCAPGVDSQKLHSPLGKQGLISQNTKNKQVSGPRAAGWQTTSQPGFSFLPWKAGLISTPSTIIPENSACPGAAHRYSPQVPNTNS